MPTRVDASTDICWWPCWHVYCHVYWHISRLTMRWHIYTFERTCLWNPLDILVCVYVYIYTQYAVLSAYPLTHLPTCRPMYHIYQHIMWSHETDTCANMPLDIHASSTETSIAMCTEIYWHGVMSMGQSTWESSICEKVQRKRRNEQEGTKERKATKREWVMDTSPGRSGNRNS